eukprot:gene12888-7309_t
MHTTQEIKINMNKKADEVAFRKLRLKGNISLNQNLLQDLFYMIPKMTSIMKKKHLKDASILPILRRKILKHLPEKEKIIHLKASIGTLYTETSKHDDERRYNKIQHIIKCYQKTSQEKEKD